MTRVGCLRSCDTGGVCGGAFHAGAGACPCRERLRGAKSGWQVGVFCPRPRTPGPGRGRNSERRFRGSGSNRRRNLDDHNGPGNEGAERGRFRTATFGGEDDVQQVAFITLVIITVLPGTARTGHSLICPSLAHSSFLLIHIITHCGHFSCFFDRNVY